MKGPWSQREGITLRKLFKSVYRTYARNVRCKTSVVAENYARGTLRKNLTKLRLRNII